MKLSLFSLLAGALTFGTTSVQATSGHATWFEQHGNPGSCGVVHSVRSLSHLLPRPHKRKLTQNQDYDYIVAVSMVAPFNYNNGFNEHCGRTVTITNVGGGDNNNGVGNTMYVISVLRTLFDIWAFGVRCWGCSNDTY